MNEKAGRAAPKLAGRNVHVRGLTGNDQNEHHVNHLAAGGVNVINATGASAGHLNASRDPVFGVSSPSKQQYRYHNNNTTQDQMLHKNSLSNMEQQEEHQIRLGEDEHLQNTRIMNSSPSTAVRANRMLPAGRPAQRQHPKNQMASLSNMMSPSTS